MEALAGGYIRNYLYVKRFPHISLVCKLVPVQYREYEYGLYGLELRLYGTTLIVEMNGSWDAYLAPPTDFFAGVDDITEEREPGIKIIKFTP